MGKNSYEAARVEHTVRLWYVALRSVAALWIPVLAPQPSAVVSPGQLLRLRVSGGLCSRSQAGSLRTDTGFAGSISKPLIQSPEGCVTEQGRRDEVNVDPANT